MGVDSRAMMVANSWVVVPSTTMTEQKALRHFRGTVAGSRRDIGTAASITIFTAAGIGTARWADTIKDRAATAIFIGHRVGSVLARCWRVLAHRRFTASRG